MKWLRNWGWARQRKVDIEILWPACKQQAPSLYTAPAEPAQGNGDSTKLTYSSLRQAAYEWGYLLCEPEPFGYWHNGSRTKISEFLFPEDATEGDTPLYLAAPPKPPTAEESAEDLSGHVDYQCSHCGIWNRQNKIPVVHIKDPTPAPDARDAERLDFLESLMRSGKGGTASFHLERGGPIMFFSVDTQHLRAGTVRAAIDAAIAAVIAAIAKDKP